MKNAILDTDTISYYFRNNTNVIKHIDTYLREFGFVNVSVISYYEVLNGLYYKDARRQLQKFERFISLNKVISLNDEIAKKSADIYSNLRKNGQIIGHNDTLIAGTAMVLDIKLITNNINHFGRVPGLEIENWELD